MVKFSDIKGFVFDLDGVVTDTSKYHAEAWGQLATKLNIDYPGIGDAVKGIGRMDALELILKKGGVENDYTPEQKEALATEKNTNYVQLIQNMTAKDILPGMADFLKSLRDNGYGISLASASRNAPTILAKIGLSDYFTKTVDPANLKNGKPDPEIFIKGAQLLNLDPSQCIGLEDAVAGIQGINAAGEVSVGIGDPQMLNKAAINFIDTTQVTLDNIKKAMA
ncbi:beta-phosphoglucomutase [Loigolactobacillus backii]|uniref:Beta-phosphoglucomutase n=1 Tax=Loigolactobacillus backii TaxID=375175 RepID=A0A192H0L1_9LACO|nr:beta-phosphoglucomutase [Loigolactobacillus backii]ANK60649.1 beta-phosphoglucomutase [Loigolactobacillus backii]ANK61782.1 beta-phosphoglucomutase [Loigolactobacillus backii]ANK65602.1 beta-phosphoglucomutase [Loigolactobacillus backii]ANK68077.1 beta-phosphoglucomutase [Loigolactobacillus backii]ANK69024.1 beta-phosphoglucomutase [Loigolactobacillus backii]